MSVEEALKGFAGQINRMNADGKRWVNLNNLSDKHWPSLEKGKIIRVYHPEIKAEDIPVYWTWTPKGDKLIKELELKTEDPSFWITGEKEGVVQMSEKEQLKKLAQELDEVQVQEKARELASWVESALNDMAYEQAASFEEGSALPETFERIKKLKAEGVIDLPGRMADDMYNDAELLSDLLGDRLHDFSRDRAEQTVLLNALKKERTHTAWQEAMQRLER
jgi:hypothetical protein